MFGVNSSQTNFIISKITAAGTMLDGYRNYCGVNYCGRTLLTVDQGDLYDSAKLNTHLDTLLSYVSHS